MSMLRRVKSYELRVSSFELRVTGCDSREIHADNFSVALFARRFLLPLPLLLLLLLPLSLDAQAKYAGELFEFPGDARSVGMGGAGVSSTHEASTGFYNPALVGVAGQASLLFAHREQFGGMVAADLVATHLPAAGRLAIQLGVVRRGVDDIPDTRRALNDLNGNGLLDDDENLIPDSVRYFNQREWGILLSVAGKNQTGWHWGANAKVIGHWLAEELGLGMGFDLGLWRQLGSMLSLGIMVQDITTTQVRWSTGRWETTAPRLTTGLRVDFRAPVIHRPVAIEGELTSRLDGRRLERTYQWGQLAVLSRLGMELGLTENLRLRAGSSTLYPFTIGTGMRFPAFSLDYAFVSDTGSRVFEPTHQVSLTIYLEYLKEFLGLDNSGE